MQEDFLHFLWKLKLIHPGNLRTTDGEEVIIISTGIHNYHSGPDFQNARVKIGERVWAGHIEIHVKSSDWQKHDHQFDAAYNNVILHVVHEDDGAISLENGETVPTMELKNRYDHRYLNSYRDLSLANTEIPCAASFKIIPDVVKSHWLERLAIERLEQKTKVLKAIWEQSKGDWNESYYLLIARNFGFKVNADAFDMLARSIPYKLLDRHSDSIFQLEALLLGQAGMLEDAEDGYCNELNSEYLFLKRKYRLTGLQKSVWKFSRLMPRNFPALRIAQFAMLIHERKLSFSLLLEAKSVVEIAGLWEVEPSDYWLTHYTLGKLSARQAKPLGSSSRENILINSVAPMLFLYGREKGQEDHCEMGVKLWSSCKVEDNSIIRMWKKVGAEPKHAANSQAFMQLKNEYCSTKKCLSCQIGVYIMQQNKG